MAPGSRAAHAAQQSRSRGGGEPRRVDRLRRHGPRGARLAVVPRHRARAGIARKRRNAAGAIGPAGGHLPHAPRSAARAASPIPTWWATGRTATNSTRLEKTGPHHVRPDDRRVVDLHRQPGNRAGHVRDFRGAGAEALRRIARGQAGGLGRHGRNGRRAAAGRHHERRVLPGHRRGCRSASSAASKRATATAWRRTLDEALRCCAERSGTALSVGLVGNCADVLPELVRRGFVPDVLTDQTSAHDPLNGYVPNGMPLEEARLLRARDPRRVRGAQHGRHGRARGGHAGAPQSRAR